MENALKIPTQKRGRKLRAPSTSGNTKTPGIMNATSDAFSVSIADYTLIFVPLFPSMISV